MAAQFRDTQFGYFVRLLSSGRLLKYPDELDPSLWKTFSSSHPIGHTSHTALPESDLEIQNIDAGLVNEGRININEGRNDSEEKKDINEGGNDIYLVGWYGSDDPENPQNWPSSWKLFILFEICILNFAVYIASSIYVPGEMSIMQEFGVSETVATLGLSLFTAGYGLGPMLWSPMSEIVQLGRSGIYFWTLLAFVLLQLPTGFATDIGMFLVFRLITGFVGSPSLATGGATIADMYDPARVAYGICIWASFGICGPVFGPILGGFAVPVKGWRWTIWIFTWLCGAVVLVIFFFLPETSAANILYRRAKRMREATGDDRYRSKSELDAAHHTTRDHLVVLARAFTLTFTEPIVFFADLYTALLYGLFFMWFESFPLVFGDIYKFNLGEQGLVFLGILIGALITVPLFLLWIRYGIVPKFNLPTFKPEMILPPTFVGSIALPICLFWYGWSARPEIHWIMPIIGSSFFALGLVTLFHSVLNYLGTVYPLYSASIFAGNTLFRASFGASFPLFARQLFIRLGIGPGNSLLGGIAVCFIPLPYILYKYGEKIRSMSKKARHDF